MSTNESEAHLNKTHSTAKLMRYPVPNGRMSDP